MILKKYTSKLDSYSEEIKKLYLENNSCNEIRDIINKKYNLNLCTEIYRRKIKKMNIMRTNSKAIKIPRRRHLPITKILKLYLADCSLRKLAKQFKSTKMTIHKVLEENNIKIRNNDEAVQLANTKYKKVGFNANQKSKAYLYGFVLGDVHIFKRSKFTLRAITHSTHKHFVELFKDVFNRYGKVNIRFIDKKMAWIVSTDLDYKSFKFLEERNQDKIPSWINSTNLLEFLSGTIDSDGSVFIKKSGEYFQFSIRFFGENIETLKDIKNRIGELNINSGISLTHKKGYSSIYKNVLVKYNKDYYTLEISKREHVIRLLKQLHLKHKEKTDRKNFMLEIYKENKTKWEDVKDKVIKFRKRLDDENLFYITNRN